MYIKWNKLCVAIAKEIRRQTELQESMASSHDTTRCSRFEFVEKYLFGDGEYTEMIKRKMLRTIMINKIRYAIRCRSNWLMVGGKKERKKEWKEHDWNGFS